MAPLEKEDGFQGMEYWNMSHGKKKKEERICLFHVDLGLSSLTQKIDIGSNSPVKKGLDMLLFQNQHQTHTIVFFN